MVPLLGRGLPVRWVFRQVSFMERERMNGSGGAWRLVEDDQARSSAEDEECGVRFRSFGR